MIIGLVGRFCAGKNTVAEILEDDFGFEIVSTRAFLKERLRIRNTEFDSPQTLREYANERRLRHGAEYLVKQVVNMATTNDELVDDLIVISDIFCVGEAEYLQKHLGGMLISVECSEVESRWNRYQSRIDTVNWIDSLEAFERNDEQDQDESGPNRPNVPAVSSIANEVIKNDGDKNDLKDQLHLLMIRLGIKPKEVSHNSETSEIRREASAENFQRERFKVASDFLERWFCGNELDPKVRDLAPLTNPSQSLDEFSNQFASRLVPIFLKKDEDVFDQYKKISSSTIDEELALLLNRVEFEELHTNLHCHLDSKELELRRNVRRNLGQIQKQDRRQFLPEARRSVSDLIARGIQVRIYEDQIPKVVELQGKYSSGKEPILEALKNDRCVEVNEIADSKISTVIHDVIDHVWLFNLLKEKKIFGKYKELFDSINEPHNYDIFQREGEAVASIGFGVRLWANSKLGFASTVSIQDILEHFHSCIDNYFEQRHLTAFQEVVRLSRNPLSRESQSLCFVFSNYLVELDEQRRKHGEINRQNLETREIIGPLDPWDIDYLSFFVETHKALLQSKNRHRDNLLRAHILLEQFLCSPATVKGTPELTIFPTKLLETHLDQVSIPHERVRWMAQNFGFTARRDPALYL